MGFTGLELRTVGGQLLHELEDDEFHAVTRSVHRSGLTVPVVDTPIGNWATTVATPLDQELELLSVYARRARTLGCQRLRVMSYPNDGRLAGDWRRESLSRMRALVRAAEQEDVVLLHENCDGWASRSSESTLDMLATISNARLRLVFDIGNGVAHGYDSCAFLEDVVSWVDHVHVKDATRRQDVVTFVPPGEGEADVRRAARTLLAAGYDGWWSLEPHIAHRPHENATSSDDTLNDAYVHCADGMRGIVAGIRAGAHGDR